jgi:hypothetical protein
MEVFQCCDNWCSVPGHSQQSINRRVRALNSTLGHRTRVKISVEGNDKISVRFLEGYPSSCVQNELEWREKLEAEISEQVISEEAQDKVRRTH